MLPEVTDYCRLYLFRHPELAESFQGLAVGAGPAELSRRGRARVLEWLGLLERVSVAAVFAPDQPQCLDPARGIAENLACDLHSEAQLRDQEMGTWEGKHWEELARDEGERVRAFFGELGEAAAPGGESLGQAVERMLGWWTELGPRVLGQTVVAVLPGSLLTGFAAAMLGMRLSRAVSLNLPHGGLGVLDVFANGVRIATWNPDVFA